MADEKPPKRPKVPGSGRKEGSKNKLPSKRSLLGKSAAEFFQNVLGIDDASVERTGQIDGKGYAGREKYEAMINGGRPVDLAWLTLVPRPA